MQKKRRIKKKKNSRRQKKCKRRSRDRQTGAKNDKKKISHRVSDGILHGDPVSAPWWIFEEGYL